MTIIDRATEKTFKAFAKFKTSNGDRYFLSVVDVFIFVTSLSYLIIMVLLEIDFNFAYIVIISYMDGMITLI